VTIWKGGRILGGVSTDERAKKAGKGIEICATGIRSPGGVLGWGWLREQREYERY